MASTVHVVCPHCDAVNRLPDDRLGDNANCGKCHQALFVGEPLALDEGRFAKHVERGDLPVVVDFWAAWCAPCRAMAPAFAEAARRLEPRVRLVKVDTEAAQGLAARYQIRSIPTLVLLRGGREVSRTAGAMDVGSLVGWIEGNL